MTRSPSTQSIRGLLAVATICSLTACDDPVVIQADDSTRDLYEAQARKWTQWALGQPHSTSSPIADGTGEDCDVGQSGKVWYLAGTFGGPAERSCTIPHNRHLFFPLVNRWGINPGTSVDDEVAQTEFIDFFVGYFAENREATCALTLRLDGEDLLGTDLEELDDLLYVDVLDPFEVEINADNWATEFGFEGGITPTLTDGHFALLRPLDPGEHVLEIGGAVCDGEEISFETSVVYELEVN